MAAVRERPDVQHALQLRREQRQARSQADREPRDYLLTGLVECARCGHAMVGSAKGPYPFYACAGGSSDPGHCGRHIAAGQLEEIAQERAIVLLEQRDGHRAVRVRPASALDGVLTGAGARFGWSRLPRARRKAVLFCLP